MTFNVGVIRGDGIGQEIVTEAVKVLDAIGAKYGHDFKYTEILMGGCSIDATGEPLTDAAIKALPQVEKVLELGYDVLVFSEDVDEFAVKMLNTYAEKSFKNILDEDLGINTDDEKKFDDDKDLVEAIKEKLGDKHLKNMVFLKDYSFIHFLS